MSFKRAYLKLTLFYIVIAMLISIFFSVVLYRISATELNTGSIRQGKVMRELTNGKNMPRTLAELEKMRLDQLEESNDRLKIDLIYFNLVILILSGGASYLLARRTLKPIEEMVDVQNRFTTDASHELRTPLTAMKTEIEVSLRDKKFNLEGAKDLLQSNLEEISKLETLSKGLLSLAQYEDQTKVPFSKVSLSKIIEDAYKKIESLSKKKEIEIEFDVNDFFVSGISQSLTELMVILMDNAIKYSPNRSKIFVSTSLVGKHAVIKVKDEGIGIKASDQPHIFDRFYRADLSRTKNNASGYGLGLSIAKKILDIHKGKVEVDSTPGKGTTFIIKLPLQPNP
ncbi:MAG: Histidine kinase [candidate division CPR2 bacterium GW2011_GWC1_41_48]|uniref:histidine kinase n=1 Tax=candidate division CPR2 bacterium GW2011_GWC1_41_48 TaxID=1618344 RepID=A0A0G0W935_UNCC2|nr:MAG: Histidine kinase [candidate division CPR2 bacterium GW2011_GWC2_39_35]KKR28998.1 MAG: Histidine kinase [candidate division CPR2 bacterium GW2011_GWD2_39_7]KKS09495.1 MAG: Histidine kinase [candidate division CPR2 bacterium GW2011_GWC1_41_48]OGB70398.1 MAG: hypothetical protein A2Y26_00275 [candidate division CPR2 bacterium GWD2_39_7]